MRRNPIHTLVSDSDTKASKSDTKNVDEIVTFIQKLITGARTKRTGCFILPLATLAFGEPALSLGSRPNIVPERHNAVVIDQLLQRNAEDRVSHRWPQRRGPRPADGSSLSLSSDMRASYTRYRPMLVCGKWFGDKVGGNQSHKRTRSCLVLRGVSSST
jgi:hypothetical protein